MAEGKFGHRVLDVILIVSACFVLYFWDLGHAPFFDKQEPREALVVWEINHSGNWILPLRNGNEIPAKPSLYHWLAALVSQSAGRIDEFTIRLPLPFLAPREFSSYISQSISCLPIVCQPGNRSVW